LSVTLTEKVPVWVVAVEASTEPLLASTISMSARRIGRVGVAR
jgi:hypothetical protein